MVRAARAVTVLSLQSVSEKFSAIAAKHVADGACIAKTMRPETGWHLVNRLGYTGHRRQTDLVNINVMRKVVRGRMHEGERVF